MRPLQRLRKGDIKNTQSSLKEKTDKQVSTLLGLMQLPDCDMTQFMQQLMKNKNYEEILELIPEEKKVDFFAKNYANFLETQEELLAMKLPQLPEIPKAKEFHLKIKEEHQQQEDADQAAVVQIIDSFSTHVLEKNTEQVMHIYKIILQMKEHSRYKPYFYSYSISKSFRQAYSRFVQNCRDVDVLVKLGQGATAVKEYFQQRETAIFEKINGELRIDESLRSLKKTLSYLLGQIEECSQQFKANFRKQLQKQPQLSLYLPKWINQLALSYYQSIQSLIYQQQEISDILKNLSQILQTSKQIESKGISLYRQLRQHISNDLPAHLQKIMEVVLESFEDLSMYRDDLYEFIEVKSLNAIPQLIEMLNPVTNKDYGKKCCSKKGILLINSFLVILLPLCQDKWSFLHENILDAIVQKVKAMIQGQKIKMPMWDYYHLFMFFYQLGQGKVRHRTLFDSGNATYLKEQITKIKRLADQCRSVFENRLTHMLWTDILCQVPGMLWQFRKYAQSPQRSSPKPTVFSIAMVFKLQQFYKQLQFRLSKQHFQYLGIQFYEYLIYVIEYVLFWSYHQKGTNTKVFTLYKKQEKLLNKAREVFRVEELPGVKNREVLKLSYFTKYGMERLVVDIYFLSDVYKLLLNGCQKIKGDEFLYKVSRILAKQLKNEPLETERKCYSDLLKQFLSVYENQPQVIKKYLSDRRAVSSSVSSKSQKSVNNSSEKVSSASKDKEREYID